MNSGGSKCPRSRDGCHRPKATLLPVPLQYKAGTWLSRHQPGSVKTEDLLVSETSSSPRVPQPQEGGSAQPCSPQLNQGPSAAPAIRGAVALTQNARMCGHQGQDPCPIGGGYGRGPAGAPEGSWGEEMHLLPSVCYPTGQEVDLHAWHPPTQVSWTGTSSSAKSG